MDDETRRYIDGLREHFRALREADMEAVKLRHADLTLRLEGFPQQYATKQEAAQATDALRRLEREALTREVYETNHQLLRDLVTKLDREKTSDAVFQSFVESQRRRDEEAALERRAVASELAAASARESGISATYGQLARLVGLAVGVISVVVVVANYFASG